jgi:hypothetical protein
MRSPSRLDAVARAADMYRVYRGHRGDPAAAAGEGGAADAPVPADHREVRQEGCLDLLIALSSSYRSTSEGRGSR